MLLGEVQPLLGEVQLAPLADAVLLDRGEEEGEEVSEVKAGLLGLTIKICCLMLGVSSNRKSPLLTLIPESESTLPLFCSSRTGLLGPFCLFACLCLSVSL